MEQYQSIIVFSNVILSLDSITLLKFECSIVKSNYKNSQYKIRKITFYYADTSCILWIIRRSFLTFGDNCYKKEFTLLHKHVHHSVYT